MTLLTPGEACLNDSCLGKIQFHDGSLINEITRVTVRAVVGKEECFLYIPVKIPGLIDSRQGTNCRSRRKYICEKSCHEGNHKNSVRDVKFVLNVPISAPERVPIPQGLKKPVFSEVPSPLDDLRPVMGKTCREQCLTNCPRGQKCTWSMTEGIRVV